jgi:glyoxylase-like metal-dependent hydrolase (beta-lactamase superfamily II)
MCNSVTTPSEWSHAGTFEVAPDVYRIPLPLPNDGLKAVNIYVILDNQGATLIDSGWAVMGSRDCLDAGLRSINLTFTDIHQFMITHSHRDHLSQAIALRPNYNIPVRLGRGERASMEKLLDPQFVPLSAQFEELLVNGASELVKEIETITANNGRVERFAWEAPNNWLQEGEVTLRSGRTLAVIETPGHTRGHVVFHDQKAKLLFSGDHILPSITPSIGFEPATSPNPLQDFLRSLAIVRALPDALLLPAHGPIIPSAHKRIDELVDHHRIRLEEIVRVLEVGANTGFDIASRLRWTRHNYPLVELDWFNRMLAICETGAHLSLLVSQKRVSRTISDGVYQYSV